MAFFEGLIETEDGQLVTVTELGGVSHYVIDDKGFQRHVESSDIDRVVLAQFVTQLAEHREEASELMLSMLGQDDLFTKAMIDSSLRQVDVEQVLAHRLPPEARQWLAMLGFRVVVDLRGVVIRVDMPAAAGGGDPDEE
jgi:hypothetical protein